MKNIKKMLAVGLLAVLFLTIAGFSGFVVAQEDDEAIEEAQVMTTPKGAQVRLDQLSLALKRNIVRGEDVIDIFQNQSLNTSELEAIKEELIFLKEDIQTVTFDNEQNSSALAAQYVALRHEAKNLTSQFRKHARSIASNDQVALVEQKIQQRAQEHAKELSQHRQKVHQSIQEFNAQQAGHMLEYANRSAQKLQKQIRSQNLSAKQIKSQVRQELQNCTQDDCSQIAISFEQQRAKQEIFALQASKNAQTVRDAIQQRLQEHRNGFLNDVGQGAAAAAAGFGSNTN
ncbi:MAG: hypothetical protein ACLFNM_01450 [Candidatus Woesearchaeota archaeon]